MLVRTRPERCCPGCAATVDERSARWCGRCGSLLSPPAGAAPPAPGRLRRPMLPVAGLVVAVALVLVAGDGLVDRSATSQLADRAIAAPDEDARSRIDRRRPAPVPATTAPTCVRAPELGCFAWVAAWDAADLGTITATADGKLVTTSADGRTLTARSLADGAVVWSVGTDWSVGTGGPAHGATVRPVGDVLLYGDGGGLVARELATGEERWRTTALAPVTIYQAQVVGDVVVVAGEDQAILRAGDVTTAAAAAAGLDLATGALRWREDARTASLAAGGVAVLVSDDGDLQVREPDGTPRWSRETRDDGPGGAAESYAWAHGHVVTIHDGMATGELFTLADGAPLGLSGGAMTSDERHTVAEIRPVGEGWHRAGPGFALFDEDGEVWRREPEGPMCVGALHLEGRVVAIETCEGAHLVLDRADGTVRRRQPAAEGPTSTPDPFSVDAIGPYELDHAGSEVTGVGHTTTVRDRRTGAVVAQLPPDSWPVWDEVRHSPDLGGVVVLAGSGWLTALRLPPGPRTVGGPAL
jgi:hypothetical protein